MQNNKDDSEFAVCILNNRHSYGEVDKTIKRIDYNRRNGK
jgi:hypothetical protein